MADLADPFWSDRYRCRASKDEQHHVGFSDDTGLGGIGGP